LLGLVSACGAADTAQGLFQQGQAAERSGDIVNAYLLYSRAVALDPANVEYLARKNALQVQKALAQQTGAPADGATDASTAEALAKAGRGSDELSPEAPPDEREVLPPPMLEGRPGKQSFDLKGDAKTIFEKVAGAYGIQVVFGDGYQSPPAFSFRTGALGMQEALRALELVANSLVVPVSPHLALVVRDTPQRRADTAPEMSMGIPIPGHLSVQEAQQVITAVQQSLQIRRAGVDPRRRLVYLRGPVSKVTAAAQLFADLSRLRAQVDVQVQFLSVDRSSTLGIGLTLPSSAAIVNFGDFLQNQWSQAVGNFANFLAFGGGKTLFGLGVTDSQAFASLMRSSSSSLLNAEIVTLDGQAGELHVGDRYPIITAGYYGQTDATGTTYAPPPTVTFEDLGLVLKVTPSVHEGGEITLDVNAEFKVLGSTMIDGIPDIGQRKFQGKVRLKPGQWAVIAGLAQTSRSTTTNGIAGLSRLPLLGRLFRRDTVTKDNNETLIVLKPRLISLPPWDFPTQTVWIGTETKPLTIF
jgi:general secretion pathway protein D